MESPTNFEEMKIDANSNEIRQMKQELSVRIQQMHIALDELEIQHNVSNLKINDNACKSKYFSVNLMNVLIVMKIHK
jgi:hypothetical protein